MAKDMTVGNPTKLLVGFAVPMLIGNLFQQFYNMVDSIVVGRFVNVQALAAVGSTGSMMFTILGFAMGLTVGFSIIISQRFGAGDQKGLRKAFAMSIYLSALISIVMMTVGLLCSGTLLKWMNTPEDTFAYAQTYLNIIFGGVASGIFYNLLSSVLRALGDSKTPLYFLILSSLINIALDLLFVLCCDMDVDGVAIATIIAQAVSGVLCLLYINKKYPILHLEKEDWKVDLSMLKELVRMGLPTAFQSSVTGLGVLFVQSVVNTFGSTYMAAYAACTKVEILCTQPMNSFGMAMATYAGQNLGAGKIGRIKKGIRCDMVLTLASGVVGMLVVLLFGEKMVELFVTASSVEVLAAAKGHLRIIACGFLFLGALFVYRNTLQGIGNAFIPMLSGFLELGIRTVASFLLAQPGLWGYNGVCASGPLAWVGACIFLAIFYYRDIARLVRRDSQTTAEEIVLDSKV